MMRWHDMRGPLQALAILLGVVAVLFQFAVLPAWRMHRSNAEQIADSRILISRLQRAGATLGPLAERLERMRGIQAATRYMLQGQSGTVAAAALQERIKTVAERHGAAVVSMRVLPPQEEGALVRITVNVNFRVALDTLQKVLYELESGVPVLVIDNAMIQAPFAGTAAPPDAGRTQLVVHLDLAGFMRKGADGNVPRT